MTDRQALLQAISKTTGASHYVVQFEVDQCISVVPRKRLLDPPVPSVGDECRVEWSGDEYTAKILAMGDEQQARKAECEYLKALSHSSENEHHQPPAKKRRLLKKKKTATSLKPKKNSKPVAAKAKKGKNADFVLDLGSPSKEENDKHQEKNNNQIKQGGLGNQGGERELHVPRSEKQHASPSQSNNQPGGLSNQGGETELHVPRSEKQHAGTSQSGKQPDVEEGHLSTFSFSSSSGDDSDEMYIGQTTPKKVITIYDDDDAGDVPAKEPKSNGVPHECPHNHQILEILLNLSASFSAMERRLTNLISDVSDIKEKQERLQSSLDCHQKGLQTTELQQPRRDPNTSFSGPFVTPSKSSTPMERKAWYMTDSFAEQFSPPGSSCARSAFEIGYPQQQQREALGKSTVPELPEKRLPLSDLPLPPPQQQSDTVQAATPATCGPKCGDGENTDPGLSVKAGATDDQQVLPIPLDSDVIMKIRYVSSSRRNFSANLNRKLFTMAERKASNVNGALGKCKLDPAKIEYIKRVTFRMYPLNSKESEAVEWGNSVSAIDEVNRRLNTTKNRKSKK